MKKPDDINVKKLIDTQSEAFLEILWTALNVSGTGRDKSILFEPMIITYYQNWGKDDDIGFTAHNNDLMIGAIWCRIKECVTDKYIEYPELGMGVLPEFQNRAIGSYLLQNLIDLCKSKYPGLRLGVNRKNIRAIEFYKRFGFNIYDHFNGAPQMQLTFMK